MNNLDNWGRFVFLPSPKILQGIAGILSGTVTLGKQNVMIPLVKFSQVMSSIGVDRHRFIDTFQVVGGLVPGAVRMLKGGDTITNSILLEAEGGKLWNMVM